MDAHVTGRSGPVLPAVVPRIQRGSCRSPRLERRAGLQEIGDVVFVTTEMLAPQTESRLTGQNTRAVSETGEIARLALVVGGVEHGTRQLRVVRPRATVQV